MTEQLNGFTGFAKRKTSSYPKESTFPAVRATIPFAPEELVVEDERSLRAAWVEVDLRAIRHNVLQIKHRLKGSRLMAVVKADAYGHGAVEVAHMALSSGADYLGVATVSEGLELRQAGIKAPIMLLSQPPIASIAQLLNAGIEPAIYTPEFAVAYAELADAHGITAPYHLAVNTGMNRIGVRHDEVLDFMRQVSFHRALELVGTFTHFATADAPEVYDFQVQVRRFMEALQAMHAAGIDPGIVHCDNSAALLRFPETNFDMVRLGISLYGLYPCPELVTSVNLRPAMSVHARITEVKSVPVSEGVSYGLTYRSPGSVKICTIPLGYADGLRRNLSNKIDVLWEGSLVHQVGNICMDQCMFEVNLRTGNHRMTPNPQIGDEVVLIGTQGSHTISADDLANISGTISYEILCGFALRLPRIYVR